MPWSPFFWSVPEGPERPRVNQGKRRGVTQSPKRKKRRRR
jgi:hypothetical protein